MSKDKSAQLMRVEPAKMAPGIVGERAKQFLHVGDPLDLEPELAAARAVLSLAAERYGLDHQAAVTAMNNGTPYKDPDERGILAALATIKAITESMHKMAFTDAVPAERLTQIFLEMRRVMQTVLQDQPTLIAQIEEGWRSLRLNG